ncbi:MAG: hypothetical protein AAF215_14145 [Cyanobacteria bacterium P01_A01_bin.123]
MTLPINSTDFSSSMRIGVDLDNTLLKYDRAFLAAAAQLNLVLPNEVKTKQQIRSFARSKPDGELLWQRLQGLAYGVCIVDHADLFPGVKRFLWRCQQRAHQVIVVSHKTEYGHFDSSRTPLRVAARDCLKKHGLLAAQSPFLHQLFFESTRTEKLHRIRTLNLDVFIDDLPEVLEGLKELALTKILFSPNLQFSEDADLRQSAVTITSTWQAVDSQINGHWTQSDIVNLSKRFTNQRVEAVYPLKQGGNAGVYRVDLSTDDKARVGSDSSCVVGDGTTVKLKVYPIDPNHDRIRSEFFGISNLLKQGMHHLPKPIYVNSDLGIGVYEWIDGYPLNETDLDHIHLCLTFIDQLHGNRQDKSWKQFPLASAACLSGVDITNQISVRLEQFRISRTNHSELDNFFKHSFEPLLGEITAWVKQNWLKSGAAFDKALPRDKQTLSPSDFGFHNMIQSQAETITFIDFEYFGWDDPTKLISDFVFHPGMRLSELQKQIWMKGCLKIYGEHIVPRLQVTLPLYGLIWCLILLNDYRPEIWHRRLLADSSKADEKAHILQIQLGKAIALLKDLRLGYRQLVSDHLGL